MYFDLQQPAFSLATRELLFVGFGPAFDANICNYPYHSETYSFGIVNDPDLALHWLQRRVENLDTFQLPYAIFFELGWLADNDFRLVHAIRQHPDLRFVPLIALARVGQTIELDRLLKNGLDDCYTVPVEWARLESRLDFLNQYKPLLAEKMPGLVRETARMKIPPLKRFFDVVVASVALVVSSVIWVPAALAILLESGWPVIYRSRRAGSHYRVFHFLKFRSMYKDADQRLRDFQHLNQYANGSVFVKLTRDPRITPVGRFIRKYSIDELPQLLNVLRGEMSIIGNRPLPLYEASALTRDEWCARFLAPAGLTGLWQVSKRGQANMSEEERIALDIAYYQDYSVWTDVKILLKTFKAFVQKEDV